MAVARRHGGPTQGWSTGLARFGLCFVLLPNLPFWLFAAHEGIAVPGWINLDGVLLGLVALWLRPAWVVGLLAVDFLLDVMFAIRATFGTSYLDLLLSTRYWLSAIAPAQLVEAVALVVGSLAVIGAVWLVAAPRLRGKARAAVAMAVLMVLVPWRWTARRERAANDPGWALASARSPALAFYHAWGPEHMAAYLRGTAMPALAPTHSASDVALPQLEGRDFVLVLVESWGEAREEALRQALAAPFAAAAIAGRYRVQQGLVGFAGNTAPGELRELCDRALPPATPNALALGNVGGCLPWTLRRRGYRTLAVDSAASFWPTGEGWYQRIGFERVLGYPELRALGAREFDAGPFRALADGEVAARLPRLLDGGARAEFVFLLTASAHLPIHLPLPAGYDADCSHFETLGDSAQACGWYRVESRTLASVAAAAAAPPARPAVWLIVGDHAPPFADAARARFSATEVPFALLVPR